MGQDGHPLNGAGTAHSLMEQKISPRRYADDGNVGAGRTCFDGGPIGVNFDNAGHRARLGLTFPAIFSPQPIKHWEVVDREIFERGFSRNSLRPREYAEWIYGVDIFCLIFPIRTPEIGRYPQPCQPGVNEPVLRGSLIAGQRPGFAGLWGPATLARCQHKRT
jgi:hypothetical protein